ncbi:MAG: hypothetical protein V1661_01355 [bacterium]
MFNLPTISIDWSFFTNLAVQNPIIVAWIVIKSGGWIPLLYLLLFGAKEVYMINIQNRWARTQKFVVLAIDVPKNNEQSPKAVENIFAHLYGMKASLDMKDIYITGKFPQSISFEIVSIGGDIQFYIRVPIKFRDLIEAAIYSQYPEAQMTEVEDYAKKFPRNFPNEKYEAFGCDFKLEAPDFYPIRTYVQFEHGLSGEFMDPMSLILETFSKIKKDEALALQILVTPLGDAWRKKGDKAIQKMLGKTPPEKNGIVSGLGGLVGEFGSYATTGMIPESAKPKGDTSLKMLALSPGERHMVEAIEMKLSKPGYPAKIRYVHFAPHEIFANKYGVIKGFLKQFAILGSNGFGSVGHTMPKKNYWYHRMVRPEKQRKLMKAFIGRDGQYGGPKYVLNIEELATLWHFPVIAVKAPLVKKTEAKRAEPPRGLPMR